MEKIYKSGTNKGNRRIWIEGSLLLQFGFVRGLRFDKAIIADGSIVLSVQPDGKHRVAGTDTRPIIDLNGKYLNDLFGSRTHFRAVFVNNSISHSICCNPCDEAGQ